MTLYHIYVDAGDGIAIPTQPDPLPLYRLSRHLREWLSRYNEQGYYFNAKMEEVPLGLLSFRVEPAVLKRGGEATDAYPYPTT